MNDYKKEFIDLLKKTDRQGVNEVIENLEDLGFFIAPASTNFHSNYKEGLLEHSVKVCRVGLMLREQMIQMNPDLDDLLPFDSVILATLLHDVCKSEIYKPAVKKRKNHYGIWEEYNGYDVNYSQFPLGHGEKSLYLISRCIDITDEEACAIRWHMSAFDNAFKGGEPAFNTASEKYMLVSLLSSADLLASKVIEKS
jgi:hypothetical protein